MTAFKEVAAVILLRSDGAALLQHRDDKPGLRHANMWTPPGGHRETGESLEHCARREFEEETGYCVTQLIPLGTYLDGLDEVGVTPICVTIFWSRYDGCQRVRCREGQDLQFVPRENTSGRRIPAVLVDFWDRALSAAADPPRSAATF